jgi:hypothetical protein
VIVVVVVIVVDYSAFQAFSTTATIATTIRMMGIGLSGLRLANCRSQMPFALIIVRWHERYSFRRVVRKTGKIQGLIYDEPFLRYVCRTQYPEQFTVLPLNLDTQLYAFAVREGSPLHEAINRMLLRKMHEPAWRDLLFHYLGSAAD